MSRFLPEEETSRAVSFTSSTGSSASRLDGSAPQAPRGSGIAWDFWAARAFLIVCTTILCYALGPFHLRGVPAASVGFLIALVILLAELRLRRAAAGALLGGVFGGTVGIFAALLVTLVISRSSAPEPTKSLLEFSALLGLSYLGAVLGSEQARKLPLDMIGELFVGRSKAPGSLKLLDTSVLIDGRIADVCSAQFLDGTLIVPQFVLRELQLVADSSDALKRQRGRRGLEVLERIQKMPGVIVRILDHDDSQIGEVDHKLVELARRTGAKIVTNDFNLNKVATVQGLSVLNVNQLANALKPIVLPGEPMRVLILREGKESTQGVAYLDDGTMVVVDGARRFINKNVDMIVTSVHQTTAGKMIFGRMEDRAEQASPMVRQAAVGASRSESGRGSAPSPVDRSARHVYPDSE